MAVKLTSTKQAAMVHGVKTLVYAKAGIGKTMLTATAPAPILISAESGLLSLRESNIIKVFGKKNKDITYDIPVIEIRNINDLNDAYQWAITSQEAKNFQTLSLDSITEIGEVVLSAAKTNAKDPRQAYGELIEKMTLLIKSFRDISGKHVYISAKQELSKDENGVTTYGPGMPGAKLGPALPYLFDEVFHLAVGKTDSGDEYRYLRTQPDLQFEAKDRSGSLDVIEQPNLTHIFNKILGV